MKALVASVSPDGRPAADDLRGRTLHRRSCPWHRSRPSFRLCLRCHSAPRSGRPLRSGGALRSGHALCSGHTPWLRSSAPWFPGSCLSLRSGPFTAVRTLVPVTPFAPVMPLAPVRAASCQSARPRRAGSVSALDSGCTLRSRGAPLVPIAHPSLRLHPWFRLRPFAPVVPAPLSLLWRRLASLSTRRAGRTGHALAACDALRASLCPWLPGCAFGPACRPRRRSAPEHIVEPGRAGYALAGL